MTVMWPRVSLICAIDEDYISFLESLKEASSKPFDADTLETLSTYFFPIFSSISSHIFQSPQPNPRLSLPQLLFSKPSRLRSLPRRTRRQSSAIMHTTRTLLLLALSPRKTIRRREAAVPRKKSRPMLRRERRRRVARRQPLQPKPHSSNLSRKQSHTRRPDSWRGSFNFR